MNKLLNLLFLGFAASCSPTEDPEVALKQDNVGSNRGPSFTTFESGQVRPLALSPNKKTLFAVNTPDNRLEIFDVLGDNRGLRYRDSVTVGLEPVAVAVRDDDEVWVVNHLSDSVSVVRIDDDDSRVVRTLLVGDEPRDIVFAGNNKNRAFITTAHRGQNTGRDPQTGVSGAGRADVWVFEANNLGSTLSGTPLTVVTLFTDTPRALAVTPDGSRVYAAGFMTGNRTTALSELAIPNGFDANNGIPGPATNSHGQPQSEVGQIVKWNGSAWVDQAGRDRSQHVRLNLPDKDVFALDANANPPRQLTGNAGFYQSVGTTLFNMAVNPANGKVYVSNTDANNFDRFEGPGTFTGHSLRGHLAESRITVLSQNSVTPRHLNKHINYTTCCAAIPNAENEASLAQPMGMEVSRDGRKLYVAAFGSSKIGVFDTSQLENNTFVPNAGSHITVSGGGPTGLVIDDSRKRLYVMTRFDNSISVIDTNSTTETHHIGLHNPEPTSVVQGRRFLYDAKLSSSHGDSSCASCHIFGDFDSLSWDLGNPDEEDLANPSPLLPFPPTGFTTDGTFRSMKGPMNTQSLRGMDNHGSMHWRGDRTGANHQPNAQPNSGMFNEDFAFKQFNPAFQGLLGRDVPLTNQQMEQFTNFILQVTYPPNPHRNLDNSLTAGQERARQHYFTPGVQFGNSCNDCHTLDRDGNRQFNVARPGFFGTSGAQTIETFDPVRPQALKVPQLRNMYQKVGMFGIGSDLHDPQIFDGRLAPQTPSDQVRGFGFFHDGAIDNLFSFFNAIVFADTFSPNGFPFGAPGDAARRDMESFMLAYDSNLAPIVGQQVTLSTSNAAVATPRINLFIARANAVECDVVAKTRLLGREIGWYYNNNGTWTTSRRLIPSIPTQTLLQLVPLFQREMTFTCVPPGSGIRIGIDNDLDGFYDGDEIDAGTDPRDASSRPRR